MVAPGHTKGYEALKLWLVKLKHWTLSQLVGELNSTWRFHVCQLLQCSQALALSPAHRRGIKTQGDWWLGKVIELGDIRVESQARLTTATMLYTDWPLAPVEAEPTDRDKSCFMTEHVKSTEEYKSPGTGWKEPLRPQCSQESLRSSTCHWWLWSEEDTVSWPGVNVCLLGCFLTHQSCKNKKEL